MTSARCCSNHRGKTRPRNSLITPRRCMRSFARLAFKQYRLLSPPHLNVFFPIEIFGMIFHIDRGCQFSLLRCFSAVSSVASACLELSSGRELYSRNDHYNVSHSFLPPRIEFRSLHTAVCDGQTRHQGKALRKRRPTIFDNSKCTRSSRLRSPRRALRP